MAFKFQDNMTVVSLDKVPSEFQPFYKEKPDGTGFSVDVENPVVKTAVENIQKLHSTVTSLRGEVAGLNAKKSADLSVLGEFGDSVETISEGVKKRISELTGQLDEVKKTGNIDIDKIKEAMNQAHAKALQEKDLRVSALEKQLYDNMVKTVANKAITQHEGIEELLLPFVEKQVKATSEDGEFQVFVVDEKGDKRFSGVTALPMTVPELIAEMKGNDQFKPLFKSQSGGGSGANQSHVQNPGQAQQHLKQGETKSSVDKIKAGLTAGQYTKRP